MDMTQRHQPTPLVAGAQEPARLLPGGLTTLALAYPAVMATVNARMALAASLLALTIPLLVWASLSGLRTLPRLRVPRLRVTRLWVPRIRGGDPLAFLFHLLFAAVLWLILDATAWFPTDSSPLPLLAAPLLLSFDTLPLLRATAAPGEQADPSATRIGAPARWAAPLRILAGSAAASAVWLGVGVLREWLTAGTVFAAAFSAPDSTGLSTTVPLGLVVAGVVLGAVRWVSARARRWAERGMS